MFKFIKNVFTRKANPYKILLRFNEIRNEGTVLTQTKISNRAKLICKILDENKILYYLDEITHKESGGRTYKIYNIIVRIWSGNHRSKTLIHSVHHDVRNVNSLNVLDNTASIANCLALAIDLSKNQPDIDTAIVFTDGEEFGGFGAQYVAESINKGAFGEVLGVVVHELTGSGQMWTNELFKHQHLTNTLLTIDKGMIAHRTPWNDVNIYTNAGINAICLGIMPIEQMGYLKTNGTCPYWGKCHSDTDDMGFANEADMKKYVKQLKLFSKYSV